MIACTVCGKKQKLTWYWGNNTKSLCDKHYRERAHKLVELGHFTEEAFNLWFENAKKGLIGSKLYTGIEYDEDKKVWDVKCAS